VSKQTNYRGIRHNVYRGCRVAGENVVTKNGQILRPNKSQKIRNHSPDGFNWGYAGSGPAQLALAILQAEYGSEVAQAFYQNFKFKFVGGWGDDWQIDTLDLDAWIKTQDQTKLEALHYPELFE